MRLTLASLLSWEPGLSVVLDKISPAAAERLGDVVAAAARVAAEAAKAGTPKDGKEGSKTGPTRETLSALAASVKRMHDRDAAAVDAAMAGLPEDQRTALASLVAGF